MRAIGRLSRLALLPLFVASTVRAEGLKDLARTYARDYALAAKAHARIPSFSRQTGLACNACHTSFPQLTPFGRMFKLNGYTLTGLQTVQAGDSGRRQSLRLDLIPPVSAMVMSSLTQVKKDVPGNQNGVVQFPQQLSVFFGSAITPRLGTFLQVTYDPTAGSIGMDNADIRYANHTHFARKVLVYGFTLNNNPTVQDVWNAVPAWGFPFAASAIAPTPAAAAILDGALGQEVAGLGAYGLWDNHLYGELSAYRSAAQGGHSPPDSTSTNTLHGVGPYWRLFYEQNWNKQSLMVGMLGMITSLYPVGITGLRDKFTDIAFNAQYERPIGKGNLVAHGIWIHEKQKLNADFGAGAATNPENTLKTLRVDAAAYTASRLGVTVGYFKTSGTEDALRYGGSSLVGSPNSDGVVVELSALPWLNTRFELQYVLYNKFNGASKNFDGTGRNAGDNNTLYLLSWVAF